MPWKQFIQSNLRQLKFIGCRGNDFLISDPLLHQLEQRVTRLSEIDVVIRWPWDEDPDQEAKISPERMTTFLGSIQHTLERFRWSNLRGMSQAAFKILSSCSRLESLDSIYIKDFWVGNEDFASCPRFPHLKELRGCPMSDRTLQSLLPSLGKIESLWMGTIEGSASLWPIVAKARFAYLSSLKMLLDSDVILCADEILSFAHCHPQLQTFDIRGCDVVLYRDVLMGNSFNDTAIIALAKCLPKLRNLRLTCFDETQGPLGEDSLISLGYHCPLLETCCLYTNVDWRRVLSEEFSDLVWPKLHRLRLEAYRINREPAGKPRELQDASEPRRLLLPRMPAMRHSSAWLIDHGKPVIQSDR